MIAKPRKIGGDAAVALAGGALAFGCRFVHQRAPR
jgi:hypothetical protein